MSAGKFSFTVGVQGFPNRSHEISLDASIPKEREVILFLLQPSGFDDLKQAMLDEFSSTNAS